MQQSAALTILKAALNTGSDASPANIIWSDTELNFMLDSALAQLNEVRPRSLREDITLVPDQETYVLADLHTVTHVDWVDSDGRTIMRIPGNAWEVWGNNEEEGQTLALNLRYVHDGYTLRVHGYADWEWDA